MHKGPYTGALQIGKGEFECLKTRYEVVSCLRGSAEFSEENGNERDEGER